MGHQCQRMKTEDRLNVVVSTKTQDFNTGDRCLFPISSPHHIASLNLTKLYLLLWRKLFSQPYHYYEDFFMFSVVPWYNGCLLHVCLPLWLSGNAKETKTERLTEIDGSEKGRSENENLAHVQSLCFMLWSLWKSEGLTGSQIWSDGGGLWGQKEMQQETSDGVRQI